MSDVNSITKMFYTSPGASKPRPYDPQRALKDKIIAENKALEEANPLHK